MHNPKALIFCLLSKKVTIIAKTESSGNKTNHNLTFFELCIVHGVLLDR